MQSKPDRSALDVSSALVRRESGQPLHRQLETWLRSWIGSGEIRPGELIPGEMELAARFGVSRHTMRHALGVLTAEGLLRRTRGHGTRVVEAQAEPPIERGLTHLYAFAWETQERGLQQNTEVLERTRYPADAEVAEHLGLEAGHPIVRVTRLRIAGEERLALETLYLPAELADDVDQEALERESIYDALERLHGVRASRASESLRAVALEQPEAGLLGVDVGAPAFLVIRQTWGDDRPIEWNESLIRGDRYLYTVELRRAGSASPAGS